MPNIHQYFFARHTRHPIADKEDGLTLVETLISMIVLMAGMLALFPLFVAPKVTAVDNEIRKAEVAIAQNILDEIRQTDWSILKGLQTAQEHLELPPKAVGENGESIQNINYGGRTFHAKITYCPDISEYTLTNPDLLPGKDNPFMPLADQDGDALQVCNNEDVRLIRIVVQRDKWGYDLDEYGNVKDGQYYTIDTIFTNLQDDV